MKKTIAKRFFACVLAFLMLAAVIPAAGAESVVYRDLSKKHWAYSYVMWATENGYMNGVGDNKFDPEGSLTRGMFVTILCRMAKGLGKDTEVKGTVTFDDVPVSKKTWYTDAVLWAAEQKVVEGVGGGLFSPNRAVTREEMGTMIYRFISEYLQLDTFGYQSKTVYRDTITISKWAREPMRQIAKMDLMQGDENRNFNPHQNATRAAAATVFNRLALFLEEYENEHPADSIKVMSYNVYYVDDPERFNKLTESVKTTNPDLLGVQEATDGWLSFLDAKLSDGYGRVGFGRDTTPENGEHGESTAIYYKKSKFDLIETQTLWLSDTPTVKSQYPESACARVMTYAILERKSDGYRFLYVNTHLDYLLNAAVKQLKRMNEIINGLSFSGMTMITGDFNIDMLTNHDEYGEITKLGWINSFDIARYAVKNNTWENQILDYCLFTSAADVEVIRYEVQTENNNSDHHPIVITFVPVTEE